jgi:hypothetical protein
LLSIEIERLKRAVPLYFLYRTCSILILCS